jgi:hypothetical protein
MSLFRNWRGRPRGLSDLPPEIRNHVVYDVADSAVDEIRLSVDGNAWRILFEDGAVHEWRLAPDGWRLSAKMVIGGEDVPVVRPVPIAALLQEQRAGMGEPPAGG